VCFSVAYLAKKIWDWDNMYLDQPLQTYLDDLASAKSAPGGGSTAALSGAMGAALVCMVSRLTLEKASYADVHPAIEIILTKAESVRHNFQALIQADIDAYGSLSAAYKLPRASAEEKAARTAAIQEALIVAAQVPLAMVENAAELIPLCKRVAEIGNKNVLSDIETAATLAFSAGTGASFMVSINLHSMKDATHVEQIRGRLQTALDTITVGSQETVTIVGERA
jgi:formiminotetrahydrofolate cyclodeaminase